MNNGVGRREAESGRAFSLVELLVVIAIIVLLVGLLLPGLGRAREAGRATVCLANEHNMGVAMQGYAADNKGYFPGDRLYFNFCSDAMVVWAPRLRCYMGGLDGVQSFWCPSASREHQWKPQWSDGYLDPRATPKLYGYEPGERPLLRADFFTYGYNGWGTGDYRNPARFQPQYRQTRQLGLGAHVKPIPPDGLSIALSLNEIEESKVVSPDDMIAIADSLPDGWWDTTIGPTEFNSHPGNRHSGGAEVLFCDGHAEWMRQSELLSTRPEARARWNNDHLQH